MYKCLLKWIDAHCCCDTARVTHNFQENKVKKLIDLQSKGLEVSQKWCDHGRTSHSIDAGPEKSYDFQVTVTIFHISTVDFTH